MIKRLTFALGLGLVAAMALASPPPLAADEKAAPAKVGPITGTIKAIDGIKVEMTLDGEKPVWVKKGVGIKLPDLKGGVGKIVDVTATSVVFNTKKASELKVGAKVNLEKGPPAPAGC